MKDTRSRPERAGINIKMRPELRARVNACATLEGLAVPEFVRAAIVAHCERSEKLHGQRSRAQAAAGAQAVAQAVGRPDKFASMSEAELNAEIDRLTSSRNQNDG